MLVSVVYRDNKMGLVDTVSLDELICSKKIKKFLRSEGWATIGVDPIRKMKEYCYKGPERRLHIKKSFISKGSL